MIVNRKTSLISVMLLIAVTSPFMSGCTVAGALIGASIDRASARKRPVSQAELGGIKINREMTVTCTNGDTITGANTGVIPLFDGGEIALDSHSSGMKPDIKLRVPQLNDTLTINLGFWGTRTCAYLGMNEDGLIVQSFQHRKPYGFPLRKVSSLSDSRGSSYDLDSLAIYVAQAGPEIDHLILRSDSERFRIPVQQVGQAQCRRPGTTGRTIGILIGLAVDATIIAVIAGNYQPSGMYGS